MTGTVAAVTTTRNGTNGSAPSPAAALVDMLNGVQPGTDRALVGHSLAILNAFEDEAGVSPVRVEALIAASHHGLPKNVGAHLFGLHGGGLVTHRGSGKGRIWKLTPDGKKTFTVIPLASGPKALDALIETPPTADAFYKALIVQINLAFFHGLYPVVLVLARKVLENLVIELVRKKYGMSNVTIWYDPKRGRFHDFSQLLLELNARLGDFKPLSAAFDRTLVDKLERFRESGNANAHSMDVLVTKEQVLGLKQDLDWLVKLLGRAIDQIR